MGMIKFIFFICFVLASADTGAELAVKKKANKTTVAKVTKTKVAKKLTPLQKYMAKRRMWARILFRIKFNRYKRRMKARGYKYSDKFLLKLYKWQLKRARYLRYLRWLRYKRYLAWRRRIRKVWLRRR